MPKRDYVKRMDQAGMREGSQPAAVSVQPSGMAADMVDGIHASVIPKAHHLLALDANAVFNPMAIPASALDGDQARGHHGIQYVGATANLVLRCLAGDEWIRLSAPVLEDGVRLVVSHYSVPSEHMYVLGGAERVGGYWEYPVLRARNDPRTGTLTTAQEFPAGSEVISMGGPGSGHLYMVSGAADSDPYIQVRDNNDDAEAGTPFSTTWKTQMGWLGNVPSWFQDLFPTHTDWANTWGFAGEDGFFSGTLNAKGGNIAGTLDVEGLLRVKDPNSNAVAEMGKTAAGFGYVLRNDAGRPVWIAATGYEDAEGNESDVAWVVESFGERAIYFRYDADEADWVLEIGGFKYYSDRFESFDGELEINSADKYINFGAVRFTVDEGIIAKPGVSGAYIPIHVPTHIYDSFRVYNEAGDESLFKVTNNGIEGYEVRAALSFIAEANFRHTGDKFGVFGATARSQFDPISFYTTTGPSRSINRTTVTVTDLFDVLYAMYGDLNNIGFY